MSDLPELINEWKSSGICCDAVVDEVGRRVVSFCRQWCVSATATVVVPAALIVVGLALNAFGVELGVFLAIVGFVVALLGSLLSLVSWPTTLVVRRREKIIRKALENG